jgi:two-component system response regulator HydG
MTTSQAAAPAPTDLPAEVPVVLLVDDDQDNLDSLSRIFAKEGLATRAASNGTDALSLLRRERVQVLVTDLMMPGMSGAELLKATKAVSPETEVVLITAYGTVEAAVQAMKEGAYDFITKPLKRHAIVKVIRQALEKQALLAENRDLKARLAEYSAGGKRAIIGQSPAFRAVMDTVRQAAPSTATVLLLGESGTGKELFARATHDASPRAQGPFVPINCAAIPETILESELFGYERGAFTGAIARKEGRFERASGGTLFLDEVAEMTPSVQVKLLRVLQEGEIERLGGTGPIKVDVRLVAASNKDLRQLVQEGRFREDLFYRLNVVQLVLPPLRERREDVPLLANHFLKMCAQKNQKALAGFSNAALERLESYAWPGNVRELENAVERAVVLCHGSSLELEDLPESVRGGATGSERHISIPIGMPMEEIELKVIQETLRHTKGDKTLAAKLLGIAARTIYRKLDKQEAPEENIPERDSERLP